MRLQPDASKAALLKHRVAGSLVVRRRYRDWVRLKSAVRQMEEQMAELSRKANTALTVMKIKLARNHGMIYYHTRGD